MMFNLSVLSVLSVLAVCVPPGLAAQETVEHAGPASQSQFGQGHYRNGEHNVEFDHDAIIGV